jgi:hypothetical protein
MSTNAAVRTAWADNVFKNINAGVNSYGYEINRTNQSATDLELGYYNQRVDFWEYLVTSIKTPFLMGKYNLKFIVTVRGTLQIDESGAGTAQQNLIDSFRTVNDYVITNLGTKWDTTIDYYEGPTDLSISAVQWGGKSAWQGVTTYTAFKITN